MYILKLLVFLVVATQTRTERRIFAGEKAKDTKLVPFVANLYRSSADPLAGGICTGSYIHPNWILTASHCVKQWFPIIDHKPKFKFSICMGNIKSNVEECPENDLRRADKIYTYTEGSDWEENDICLMHIEKPFVLSETIKIAKIQTKKVDVSIYINKECTVAGWGMVSETTHSESLMQGTVIVDGPEKSKPRHMRVKGGTAVTCSGDSGSPLVCDNVVIGVLRGSIGKCDNLETKTSWYILVQEYSEWINKITGGLGAGAGTGVNNIVPNYLCLCILPMILLKL